MGDISWMSAVIPGGAGGGTHDYEELANVPIKNIAGVDVVVADLPTGVYNIDGTWKVTATDESRETFEDDLFYVMHGENGILDLSWVSSTGIKSFHIDPNHVDPDNPDQPPVIKEDVVITSGNATEEVVGTF